MSRDNNNHSDKFLRGAMILTLAGLVVKIIGSVNRILLSRLLGGEGIGLYQMAYPVYLLLLALSSAGIPVAISILVSRYLARDDFGNARRVFRLSLRLMALLGLVLASALVLAALWLSESGIIRDTRAYYSLVALAPAVFFGTILASFRGFFQGHQLMMPPAVSQILEQFVRVTTMLALAWALLPRGLEFAAAGAAFGAVPGSLTGLVALGCFYRYYRRRWQNELAPGKEEISSARLIKELVLLALPVSCANVLVPVTNSIDVFFVPGYLIAGGFSVEEATTLFGYLAGMAQPLLLLATIPTMSLATSLVPAVAEAHALKRSDLIASKAGTAMKLCCLVTLPAAVGMAALAEPLSLLLYGTARAGTAILHAAPSLWLLGMQQVTTGMLQGMGHSNLPMLHMLAGILLKLALLSSLVTAEWNIAGAAWATNINFGLTALLNILLLRHYKIYFNWHNISKIFLAALAMGAAARWLQEFFLPSAGSTAATAGAILLAALLYALLLVLLRVLSAEEAAQLREKICRKKA